MSCRSVRADRDDSRAVMRRFLALSIFGLVAVLIDPTPALAQWNARDFAGIWNRVDPPGTNSDSSTFEDLPMTPWAQKRYDMIRDGVEGFQQGREDVDQLRWPYCLPPGTPRAYLRPGPMEVVQSPIGVYMIFETNKLARQIYTDGRPHPDGAPTTSMGHSIGRWDGDTLVVDTVGLDPLTWIDGLGHPHTDALHIEERIRRISETQLEIQFRFDDPGAYTQPWGGTKLFDLKSDWELMEYSVCQDRSSEEILKRWEEALGEPW